MFTSSRLAIVLAVVPTLAFAQSGDTLAILEGHVRDAVDSGAVAYAEVRIGDGGLHTRADGRGRYRIAGIPPGTYPVTYRVLGYTAIQPPETFVGGQTVTRDVYLARVPQLLSAMQVRGKNMRVPAGFESIYRRAALGLGSFVTREQIDSLPTRDILSVIHRLPFVRTEYTGQGKFNRVVSQRCEEFEVLLNGTPITRSADAIQTLLYETPPSWVQAIEVYDNRARMPVEFLPNCGVLAVWTRPR